MDMDSSEVIAGEGEREGGKDKEGINGDGK